MISWGDCDRSFTLPCSSPGSSSVSDQGTCAFLISTEGVKTFILSKRDKFYDLLSERIIS